MQMRGEQEQRQHACRGLGDGETESAKKSETDQRREHVEQNVGAVADHNVPHAGGVAVVVGKDGKAIDAGSRDIEGQHEQRLADAVPGLLCAVAAVDAELGVLVGEDGRVAGPEGVGGVFAMLRVR